MDRKLELIAVRIGLVDRDREGIGR